MQVGVGFSDNPNSLEAGRQAAVSALEKAGRTESCDMVLLFCTSSHNQQQLRDVVTAEVGSSAKIYGGGAAGVITNETFGYAGDQVGVACIWLDGAGCEAVLDNGLMEGEEATGIRLGENLAKADVTEDSSVMLFYDDVKPGPNGVSLMMATWLLAGIEKGLGFLPPLTGAGMQGDHVLTQTSQFIGDGIGEHYAMALAFSDDICIDSVIMHGCRPASQYFTVTRAKGPVILEINGVPAITFVDELIDSAVAPEEYPFFLLFGINHGERWGEFDEKNYASRLCLGIDKERGGIVMFEPDMVEGTQFQLMFRSLDLDYMKPKIEKLFDDLDGREPVFGVYIDCAGRCAGYGGVELEDALVLQETVNGRVPLLGLYTGVEIAPTGGRSRGLDWTGVFCLFSQRKPGDNRVFKREKPAAVWEAEIANDHGAEEIPLEAVLKLSEQNAAKVLNLDIQSIALRHELEQKRRGFRLLSELSVSLRHAPSYESVFIPVAQRLNAALNMQKTVMLIPLGEGNMYTPTVLHGYSTEEKVRLAGQQIKLDPEMLDPEQPVLITAADDPARMSETRSLLNLPYFISSPIVLQNQVAAVLITGRMAEQAPYLLRLGNSDTETVQAISALLGSVLTHQRLEAAEERSYIMVNAMPLCCIFWDENGECTDCNEEAQRLFGTDSKEEFLKNFYSMAPEFQPDGRPSEVTARSLVLNAFVSGAIQFEWLFKTQNQELLPTEVSLVRLPRGEDYIVAGYVRDLREQKAAIEEISRARDLAEQNARAKSEFLASVSHEIRTPMNGIMAMARAISEMDAVESVKPLIEQGIRSANLLAAAIDSILDFSRLEAGQVELDAKSFSVREMVDSIVGMLSADAAAKSLDIRTEISPDLPDSVIGDPTRLEQAIFNIAANAVKFTDEGTVTIRVYHKQSVLSNQVEMIFELADTGIGISAEQQAQLFTPLNAIDTSYARRHAGFGMGLAVSWSIALLMGGDISCQSSPGQGSTFTLSAPLNVPEQTSPEIEEESPADDYTDLAGMRILAAEDNSINQMIISEMLSSIGVESVIANNGIEALDILKTQDFDLVFMDIQMPEMDGLTAAAQIRLDHRYDNMPILAMTANSAPEHREESLRSGMEDHLTKPINMEEVYAALKRWGKK